MQDFRHLTKKNHSSYKFLFRKPEKINRLKTKGNMLRLGVYGVKLLESCNLQLYQLRSLHLALLRVCKGFVRFWFFVQFSWPLTSKPSQRMGTGKGKVHHWVARVNKGTVLLEFSFLNLTLKNKIFAILYSKFPAKIKIISRLQ